VTERAGVLAAVLSSGLGGVAAAATRAVIGGTDPITLAAFRFGLGFLFLLPIALARPRRWPPRQDWSAVAALGLLFFAVFFVLFNVSLTYTTAARGALALSTLPLLTMVVAAALGVERLTARKTAGVLIALGGVAVALAAGVARAPAGAWRGDLVMVAGALCMAGYSVWSRPFIGRSGPLAFTTAGMGVGAAALALIAWWTGGFAAAGRFGPKEWTAIGYLGVFGAALVFYLWAFALERTTPTRVVSTITVNPVTASIVAALLLGEPIGISLVAGVAAVVAGIWIASTERRPAG
jgi:drug/metabolite transporter (DMT)-like permease